MKNNINTLNLFIISAMAVFGTSVFMMSSVPVSAAGIDDTNYKNEDAVLYPDNDSTFFYPAISNNISYDLRKSHY